MSQLSFSDEEYSGRKRITKREEFLKTMNEIIPWTEWVEKNPPVLSVRETWPSCTRDRIDAADVSIADLVRSF